MEVAAARERCANELEAALHTQQNEALAINEAALESGYSAEYLRRLVRSNPGLNAGKKRKPLILRRDLPRRTRSALAGASTVMYSVEADAQSLMSRRGVS